MNQHGSCTPEPVQDEITPSHGRTPKQARIAAQRRIRAVQLRTAGYSFRRIAADLGVSAAQVRRDINAALDELARQETKNLAQLRALEAARVDEMWRAVWPNARQGIPIAIQQALQLMERRARLYGLDAAGKVDILMATEMDNLIEILRKGVSPEEFQKILSVLAVSSGKA